MNTYLFDALRNFTQITRDLSDTDLEKTWSWGSYENEGIRFAFFRTYEELQELAVKLEQERMDLGMPVSSAQRILGGYHHAFRDLDAVLLNVAHTIVNTSPSEGEWSIRETLAHMLAADLGFYVAIRFAIENHRNGVKGPNKIPEKAWETFIRLDEESYDSLMEGSYQNLREYQVDHHKRIIGDFAGISKQELQVGSRFWETEEMDLRFRLHRFDSHFRQHTIQIEKALNNLGHFPSESARMLRHIYRALAECESRMIGIPDVGKPLRIEFANKIDARVDEIAAIL